MHDYDYAGIKAEFKLMFDPGDPWGSTMLWWFAIADSLLFTHDVAPPQHWQFRPSPLGPSNEPEQYETEIVDNTDPDALVRFGNLLTRYAAFLKRAGMNY
jgi:hypothetical protein